METGALIRDAGGRVPGGCGAGEDWFAPFRPSMPSTDPRAAGRTDLESLNRLAAARGLRTESGLPLRFVDANEVPSAAYERVIHERGEVPTRLAGPGMLHDWFNAMAWIAWPRTKARLNRLQSDALAACDERTSRRGALRDAATLFDESGAVFACRDPALAAALRRLDWQALFVDGRERFGAGVGVRVVGHGVLEKLLAPYKGLCAHAWVVDAASTPAAGEPDDALDACCAASLQPQTLRAASLCPLPLLGVPGWWPANEDPRFYADRDAFRTSRRTR